MKKNRLLLVLFLFPVSVLSITGQNLRNPGSADPLSLWNKGPVKQKIIRFVSHVCDQLSPYYVKPSERLATFDLDGTLLCEKPFSLLSSFTMHILQDRLNRCPGLAELQPFRAVLEKDRAFIARHFMLAYSAAFNGMTEKQYRLKLKKFLTEVNNPQFNKPFEKLFYQPVLQLVHYLLRRKFTVYIVSGSEQTMVRTAAATQSVLSLIPPQNIIGSRWEREMDAGSGQPVYYLGCAMVKPENLRQGKGININSRSGTSPILTFGNSRGDCMMFYSAVSQRKPFLNLLLNHDDRKRESFYPFTESSGPCPKIPGVILVSMKKDFATVFQK